MSKLLYQLPKPLLFGILGAMGCLIGWLLGEPVLATLKAGNNQRNTGENAPVLVFGNEFRERQEREGAKSGAVQITLMWDNFNDLDLHCIDPQQEHIYYGHKMSATGGELDVDMNVSSPYSAKPVENIYFPTNGAALGHYQVLVDHYAGHGGMDPTAYVVGVKANGIVRDFKGTISHGDPITLVYAFDIKPPASSLMISAPRGKAALKPALTVGVWTALLATALSFLLVLGQNGLMRRRLLTGKAAFTLVKGGLLAGLVAGGASQYLFSASAQVLGGASSNLGWLLKSGQVVGWMILGGLLGWSMGLFIPNLPKVRGGLAGMLGGFLGALVFLFAIQQAGETVGRMIGSTILGAAIGYAIAFVEEIARAASLIVRWGPKETTTISLGTTPVTIGGGDDHVCLRGLPTSAYRVWMERGKIFCLDQKSGRQSELKDNSTFTVARVEFQVALSRKHSTARNT